MKLYKKILIFLICIILISIILIVSKKNIFQDTAKNVTTNTITTENIDEDSLKRATIDKTKNVSMSIEENTLTKTSATIIIKDTNEEPLWYDAWFRIDKYNNGDWEMLPANEKYYCFFDLAYGVNEEGILKMKTSWKMIYGELEAGKYRIVKDVAGQNYYIEFTID